MGTRYFSVSLRDKDGRYDNSFVMQGGELFWAPAENATGFPAKDLVFSPHAVPLTAVISGAVLFHFLWFIRPPEVSVA